MRLFYCFLASLFIIHTAQADIPQVPSSIEIAGVKLKLTNDAQEEIQRHVNALRASDKYFQIKLDRVNLYFPIVERVLKEEGVPEDIKYLAIQESALISDAVSSSDAVGYWQFKDFTAREVGLRVDSKIDERKNIVSATRGAAKYFKRNNFFFKNWIYAVSAYQAGPGGAKRYVDKANFGSDKLTITKNTHWYVLKYIAHVVAFKDEIGRPHSEGLKLGEYTKGEGKSIEQVARELKADEELTLDYNKWLRHGKIPDDKVYTVIVPTKGKLPKMVADRDDSPPPLTRSIEKPEEKTKYPDRIAGDIITKNQTIFLKVNGIDATMASKGDDASSLAKKAGIEIDKLLSYNDLKSTAPIESGEIYYVHKKKNRSSIFYHVAQYGESTWDIAQKYGIKLDKLKKKNRMEPNESLKPGRLMWLRKKRPADVAVEYHELERPKTYVKKEQPTVNTRKPIAVETKPEVIEEELPPTQEQVIEEEPKPEKKPAVKPSGDRILHVIQPGETLWNLSKRYEVEVSDIKEWNGMTDESTLSVGQEISIYRNRPESPPKSDSQKASSTKEVDSATKEVKSTSTKPENQQVHVVAAGESLWSISQKYSIEVGLIRSLNNLSEDDPIKPGQELKLISGATDTTYTVRGGDSLYKIAKEYGMTVDELMKLNELSSSSLSVGQELRVKK
ncbi:LysM peptidoglycan-binding domain-containing protein [Marinoscillum sp.]|uniref:LysM peptidoglycan-binding domain-containing protein n=1 Tax=Marinoscillum sp. TaxID=2024838 RepID=UPI003BAAE519